MPLIRVGINGFGPVGRQVFSLLWDYYPELKIAAVGVAGRPSSRGQAPLRPDDLIDSQLPQVIEARPGSDGRFFSVDGQDIPIMPQLEPCCASQWAKHNIELVIDTTGSCRQRLNLGLIKLDNKASLLYHDSNPIVSGNGHSTTPISLLTLQRVISSALIWIC
jgi:glyceraldehyde-3-phosphate dehydrogenase/erythrose-4-phosphate dehydrogenase